MKPIFLLSGLGMVIVGIITITYWKARAKISWSLFFWGGFAWIVSVVLKGIASLPSRTIVNYTRNVLPDYISEPLLWLYSGLMTGIFECGITLLFAYKKGIKNAKWEEAMGFGIGYGAFEAVFLGINSFILTLLVVSAPGLLPEEVVKYVVGGNNSPLIIPADVLERITAVLIHILSCLLIIYSVQTRQWRWFLFSFLYKTAIDAIAGYLYLTYGIENLTVLGRWIFEIAILPFGIIGVWGLFHFKNKWKITADLSVS